MALAAYSLFSVRLNLYVLFTNAFILVKNIGEVTRKINNFYEHK